MRIGNANVDFNGLIIDGPAGHYSMEPKIMDLLRVLADNAGQVMSREDLIVAVWGVDYGGDERLSRAISILRKALGDKRGNHTHIVTISRKGYRLIAQVSEDDAPLTPEQTSSPPAKSTQNDLGEPASNTNAKVKTPKPAFLKRPAILASFLIACLAIGISAFTGLKAVETVSLQSKLDRGFAHVQNFTHTGAIEDAKDIFSGVLADNPNHAAARAGLAFAVFREYTHLERDPATLQRAKAHAQAAFRQDKHLALANIAAGWAAEFDGDFELAHEHLDRADLLDPDNIYAIESRYRTYGRQGNYKKALETINAAIETYPENALFRSYRGNLYMRKEDYNASVIDFKSAIALAPDNPRSYAALAHSLHMQNLPEAAIATIQQGLKVNETALLYNNLGTYLFFQGQYDLAASAFEKTLDLSGDTHDYLYWANLGDAYRWSPDKSDEAATAYRRALQLLQADLDRSPNDDNLKSRAALFNAKLGNLDEAQRYMGAIALTSKSPSIQLYRAVVTYEIMSNRTKALEHLEDAIAANYPLIEILNDPELARLRQDPAYHRLLAKTQND